ncbi:hypothetical protein METBIDRAFT_206527 [Metschnikowia bicuspidata var. bicuspidata NRRL YB-4993]|uniref:Uncharacterized protein n=1 Tax=Metschnikowia bicuspidata var. bicuspidata NRRL YB-4993 TaxID=869754 RepID=A0A1A0H6X4_9ASCO|nr:hypothetical protein METBIDRAFT_206527 [Metschnikowia bicuspidata var. bicuspidata NRRL YB-4993]OBA19705.1 hypothetical protein METBIDRAFT_206527 [Metschnikowia bicuspidata var. bicuspidata NRRL YB-4993]
MLIGVDLEKERRSKAEYQLACMSGIFCHHCHKVGHMKVRCVQLRNKNPVSEKTTEPFFTHSMFIYGSNTHVVNDMSFFQTPKEELIFFETVITNLSTSFNIICMSNRGSGTCNSRWE